ncbi:MAG: tetratricopeptide repeat protein [Pirellulaceae bacterium]|nr:tetratricopeptide repeat protein [Pirellulaceae bacterium]
MKNNKKRTFARLRTAPFQSSFVLQGLLLLLVITGGCSAMGRGEPTLPFNALLAETSMQDSSATPLSSNTESPFKADLEPKSASLALSTDDQKNFPSAKQVALIEDYSKRRALAQLEAARHHAEANNFEMAQKTLEQLLSYDSQNHEARLLLADLFALQENYRRACDELMLLQRQKPEDSQVYHSLGLCMESAGFYDQAYHYYQQAVHYSPQNELYRLSLENINHLTF